MQIVKLVDYKSADYKLADYKLLYCLRSINFSICQFANLQSEN
jgi:hypothetical protein